MKLLIASDIHGCKRATQQLLHYFESEQYDYLLLLGDILNHGPRNPVPERYGPMEVIEQLNEIANKIIAIRGNCDSEVDQAMLHFPMMADYNYLLVEGRRWFLTHGHNYMPDKLPPIDEDDLFCYGHLHTPELRKGAHCWQLNPGSTTIPRYGNPPTFVTYQAHMLSLRHLHTGETLQELSLKRQTVNCEAAFAPLE